MVSKRFYNVFLSFLLLITGVTGQLYGYTQMLKKLKLNERAKVLIIHGDDFGVSHSVNAATFGALKNGAISSASIMMPCSWSFETAQMLKSCDGCDVGVHVTLNSEWEGYRWGPITTESTSLLDHVQKLHRSPLQTIKSAKSSDVLREVEAQVLVAKRLDINLSHIDMHMGTVGLNPEWLDGYLKIAQKYKLVAMLPKWNADIEKYFTDRKFPFLSIKSYISNLEKEKYFMLDRLITDVGGLTSLEERRLAYEKAIKSLKPGITQIITHLSTDSEEFASMTANSMRERRRVWDAEILNSDLFRQLLRNEGVTVLNWGHIQNVLF